MQDCTAGTYFTLHKSQPFLLWETLPPLWEAPAIRVG